MVINGALPSSLRKIFGCRVRGYATKWNRKNDVVNSEHLKAKQSNRLHCDKEGSEETTVEGMDQGSGGCPRTSTMPRNGKGTAGDSSLVTADGQRMCRLWVRVAAVNTTTFP